MRYAPATAPERSQACAPSPIATNDTSVAEAERVDAALAKARVGLGAQRYGAAWFVGARRSVDEAAERAQQLLTEHATTTRPVVRTSLSRAPRSQDMA